MRLDSQVEPMPTVVVTMQLPGGDVLAFGHLGFDLLQFRLHAVRRAEQLFADFGQDEAAGVADEELQPEVFLERRNLPARRQTGSCSASRPRG